MATPVPVLTMETDRGGIVAPLDEGEALQYSYEQSIYLAPVFEEFVRAGDRLDLLRVRSPDIQAVEYFRWDGDIRQDDDGLFTQEAPPNDVSELVIRITPGRRQTLRTSGWTRDLEAAFGESIVRIRAEHRPRIVALLAR